LILPLINGDNRSLLEQFEREEKIKQNKVPAKVNSLRRNYSPAIKRSEPNLKKRRHTQEEISVSDF